jgi:hypothetical protein
VKVRNGVESGIDEGIKLSMNISIDVLKDEKRMMIPRVSSFLIYPSRSAMTLVRIDTHFNYKSGTITDLISLYAQTSFTVTDDSL